MVPRDLTLSSLYDARRRLGELIVRWSPDRAAGPAARARQAARLERLLLERDKVNGAINAVIDAEFQSIASPELMQAAEALGAVTARLARVGETIAEIDRVIKVADQVVAGAAQVVKLAQGGLP